jgi:hypothetical protein
VSSAVLSSEARRRRHAALSSKVALMDDATLARLVGKAGGGGGWGWSGVVTLPEGDQVFVKRIPVTATETKHRHSTRNHHRLPIFYSYGVGSAGFGAYRELATHVRTTGWVVGDEIGTFPLLVHARHLPRRPGKAEGFLGSEDYVRYWNGSRRIGRFIAERAAATEELCLVLEVVPHQLRDWLVGHQADAGPLLARLCETIGFLHDHGVLHFDAHFGNTLTDGSTVALTDFGLAMDASFELTEEERAFFARHQHYDFGEAIANLAIVLEVLARARPPETLARIDALAGTVEHGGRRARALTRAIRPVTDEGLLDVDPSLVQLVERYREVIEFMWSFFEAMQANPRKNTPFEDARLAALLADAGGLP